ncbi:histidine phosphatase family protein [Collinsella sp. zg1085]|uniref:histidine phosphatase family protein n=1 Tax=Collinsella sp. zg1085 TaxID=2844380 RepID=UPI001C0B88D2|nr:histidine phosphatase family protein [Collinsella sp. zg1085]QWT17299.1 histidine phosphatase family protein [Collinsella sp. zg1085]
MPQLYLMRHGETEFNLKGIVQGHCDSPLTLKGVEQAKQAARFFQNNNFALSRFVSSPLGRAQSTMRIMLHELGYHQQSCEIYDELIERSYGIFDGKNRAEIPVDIWRSRNALTPFGGESDSAVQARMTRALTRLMHEPRSESVLALSHGSATVQFKNAWEDYARCKQDVWIGNCFILVYEFDCTTDIFTNTAIIDPMVAFTRRVTKST